MKMIDLTAAILLIVGGLNWGLVGLFGFDLVEALLGEMSAGSRLVYGLVGLAAVYQSFTWRTIERRDAQASATA